LHIIIGMVEKLEKAEVEARNRSIFATIMLDNAKKENIAWLENDGILLTELQLEKQQIKQKLSERVSTTIHVFV
jgi:hypothetical protein